MSKPAKTTPAGLEPLYVRVSEAVALSGISSRVMYDLLNSGAIANRYQGRSRLVSYSSLKDYLDGLPQEPAA